MAKSLENLNSQDTFTIGLYGQWGTGKTSLVNMILEEIKENGGVEAEQKRIAGLASYFRDRIKEFPFDFVSESMSNAVTPLHPITASAYNIFTIMKDHYGIWICPNGGEMKDTVFRVGHLGALTTRDYDQLIDAFKDLRKNGII